MTRSLATAAAFAALALFACGGDDDDGGDDHAGDGSYDCTTEDRDDVFQVDLARAGERGALTFRLLSATPAPPARGDNTWSIAIVDGSGGPVVGAAVKVTPFMPDHRHGTGIKAQVSDQGDGRYQAAPLNLWMPGLWEITIEATPAGGAADRAVFRFCIAS